jgi:hypothetical protein
MTAASPGAAVPSNLAAKAALFAVVVALLPTRRRRSVTHLLLLGIIISYGVFGQKNAEVAAVAVGRGLRLRDDAGLVRLRAQRHRRRGRRRTGVELAVRPGRPPRVRRRQREQRRRQCLQRESAPPTGEEAEASRRSAACSRRVQQGMPLRTTISATSLHQRKVASAPSLRRPLSLTTT